MNFISNDALCRVRASLETINKPRVGPDYSLQIGSYMASTDPGLASSVSEWLSENLPEFAELPEDTRRMLVNRAIAAWVEETCDQVTHLVRDRTQDWLSGPRPMAAFGELIAKLAAQRLRDRAEVAA